MTAVQPTKCEKCNCVEVYQRITPRRQLNVPDKWLYRCNRCGHYWLAPAVAPKAVDTVVP